MRKPTPIVPSVFLIEDFQKAMQDCMDAKSVRCVATEIGISHSCAHNCLTNPDAAPEIGVFLLICDWMRQSPRTFFKSSFDKRRRDKQHILQDD